MDIKQQILVQVENLVEQVVTDKSDALVDYLLAKLTHFIPGQIDDKIAAQNAPALKLAAKEFLLKEAHKIDGDPST